METYIPVEADGTMQSIAQTRIQESYEPVLRLICADILGLVGEKNIRSIILRGSVACHTDIPGVSDLDLVIFPWTYSEELAGKLGELACEESERWGKLFSLVDLSCERFERLLTDVSYHRLYLNLKLTGVTLWGENLIARLPAPRCDRETALKIARQTWQESCETADHIFAQRHLPFMGEMRGCDFLCVWFLRSFCRGLIVPAMLSDQVFSLNVQTCAVVFAHKYPQYAKLADRCRQLECDPTDEWERLQEVTSECLELYRQVCVENGMEEVLYVSI